MKKLTTILVSLSLLISLSSFAVDVNISDKIKSSFQQSFVSASDVKWTQTEGIYIASFKVNEETFKAVYNESAELLGIARYIALAQLPLKVTLALQNKYSEYTITPEVVELAGNDTSYYIYAENEKFKFKIKSDASGNLSVENKTRIKK